MRLVAMPYSHGRADSRVVSKDPRRSNATRNTSPSRLSASPGSTRRARNRWRLDAWRSKIAANAAGSDIDSWIAVASGAVIVELFAADPGRVRELAATSGEERSMTTTQEIQAG